MTANAASLRITLQDIDPAPWREIEVPLSMSFKGLHDAIQAAFLWFDCHLWEFELDDRKYGMPEYYDEFFGPPLYKATVARLTKLRDWRIETLRYVYDMGDDWVHRIDVLDFFIAEPQVLLPNFLAGQWRTPPEDVGGAWGFEEFLHSITNPRDPEHERNLEWYGGPFVQADIQKHLIQIGFNRLALARKRRR